MEFDAIRLLLLATLFGTAYLVPLQDLDTNSIKTICSTECPPMTTKMFGGFDIGKSYTFLYNGYSLVNYLGVSPNATSKLSLQAEVVMSFYSPCDVSLQIKKPLVNGVENKEMQTLLTKYPLMAGISHGIVKDVCAHPDDDPISLNFKKGILSTMQNSLPYWPQKIDTVITEKDVLGICPTSYRSFVSEKQFAVIKFRDHKQCTGQHSIDDQSPLTSFMLRSSSLSLINSSSSECYQSYYLDKKILFSAGCVDTNVVQLDEKTAIKNTQDHTLEIQSILNGHLVPKLKKIRRTDLLFELLPDPTSDAIVPTVKTQLKKLCKEVQSTVEEEAAATYEELITNLQRVPKDEIKQLLLDIKDGKFCRKYEKLESLYLDALPYLNNAGALEVMVDQVLSGKVTGGRTFLYTIALQFTKQPTILSVKAISPLFESKLATSPMVLAAGSLVRKYCKSNDNCLQEKSIREILQKLADRIDSTCPSSKDSKENKLQILTVLKTIGNIGTISKPLEYSILKCLTSEESDTFVRVSAAQAFRQSSCETKPIENLLDLALSPSEDTEVRIASYLAAVTCANYEQASLLLSKIEKDLNTQVRSFILSHLRSLQRSEAPYLKGLRNNLTNLYMPIDFGKSHKKLSKGVDMSYYLPTLGVGAGVDSSIIYSPESSIPRQMGSNITVDLFDNVVNIGEFSLRTEDFEALLSTILGSYDLLECSTEAKLIKMALIELAKKGENNSLSNILKGLNKQGSNLKSPKLDAFARIFGQEMAFTSLTLNLKDFEFSSILEEVMEIIDRILLRIQNSKSDARGAQVRGDHFIPTSQGIPLHLKGVLITVATFDADYKDKHFLAVSYYANIFVGYNIGAKTGFRIRAKGFMNPHISPLILFTKENVKMTLDMPKKKTQIIDFRYNCSMMNKLPGRNLDEEVYPKQNYPIYTYDHCNKLENKLNLIVCSHLRSPDYRKVHFYPFGTIDYSFDASKPQPDKELLNVMLNVKYEKTEKSLDLKVEAPGTKDPNLIEVNLLYKTNPDSRSFLVFVQGPNKKGKALQVNMKHKLSKAARLDSIMVYFSNKKQVSSYDQVMSIKMKESQREKTRTEFYLRTKNILAKYADTNVLVDVYSESSSNISKSSLEINKLEFHMNIPKTLNTTHYIRKTPETTGNRLVYDIYSLSKTPSTEVLKITGNYSAEGEVYKLTRASQATLSLRMSESEFTFLSQHSWTRKKKQFLYSFKAPESEKPLFLAEAAMVQIPTSDSAYGLYAQVGCPKLIPTYRIDGALEKNSPQDMHILMDLKEDGKILYKAEGSVNVELTSTQFKERAEIKVENVLLSQEYEVKTQLFIVEGTKDAWIIVTSNGSPIFKAEVEFISENDLISSTVGLTIPKTIDAKLKAEKTGTLLHMVLNSFILQNTVNSRKIKASSYLNLVNKEMKVRFAYDLEKDPNKKIDFMTHYDYNDEKKYASIKGELALLDDLYKFGAETMLGAYTQDPDNKNLLKIKLIMPDDKEFVFNSECLHIKTTSYRSTYHSILLKTASGERHELKSSYKYNFSKVPVKMMIVGRTEIDSPLVKRLVIVIDSGLDINEALQKGHYKMEIESEKISFPIKTNLEFDNQEKEFKANALIDLDSSSNLRINGETLITRNNERNIEDASVHFTVDLPDSNNYNVRVEKKTKSVLLDLSFNGKVIVTLEQSSPSKGVWIAKLTTPLRRTEAHSTLTSDALIFTVYPNRLINEEKFKAEGHFRQKESSLETGARFKHPNRENEMMVQLNIERKDKTSSQGKVELDIFETPQDKIVIEVRTQKSNTNSLKLEADVKIPNQSTVPRIDLEVALSKTVKHIDVFLRKSASEEPRISFVMRMNHPTSKTSMVYSKLSTSLETIEIMSEVKHHDLQQCTGKTINGTVLSTKHGSFNFKSAVCTPGYLEFGAKKLSEDKIYMAKVGMKRPNAAKVAIDLIFDNSKVITEHNFWDIESTFNLYGRHKYLPKRSVILVGAKLWWSKFVTMDATYNTAGLKDYYKTVVEPAYKGTHQLALDLLKELPKDIHDNILQKLPKVAVELASEVHSLKEKLSQELSVVLEELGLTVPNLKELRERIEASLQKVVDVYQKIVDKADELFDVFGITSGVKKLLHVYHDLDMMIQHALVTAAKEIRHVIDKFVDGKLHELPAVKWLSQKLGGSVWDWFKRQWKNFKNLVGDIFNEIKTFFRHWGQMFKNIFHRIIDYLKNFPILKSIIDAFDGWFNKHDWYEEFKSPLGFLITKYFSFSVTPESGLIRFQVPIKKPVTSLSVAMRNVGVSLPKMNFKEYTNKQTNKCITT